MSATRRARMLDCLRDGSIWTSGKFATLFNVDVRTIYRDIARLRAAGVAIKGEIGVGFIWRHPPTEENDG